MITGASTLGSIGKIANTINKGFIAATLDKEYVRKKEVSAIKNAPTGIASGIVEGTKGLGMGIWGGVSGFATKPIQGAYDDGVTGFFKGMAKGTMGLVFKPVSGAVDLISKSTQGLEQSATGTPICQENRERMREPRAFYQKQKIVRPYNAVHAKMYNMLRIRYRLLEPFMCAFKCGKGQTDSDEMYLSPGGEVMIWTGEHLLSVKREESQWRFKIDLKWRLSELDREPDFFTDYSTQPTITFTRSTQR